MGGMLEGVNKPWIW